MSKDSFLNFGLERIVNPLNYFGTIYFPFVRFKEEERKYRLEIEMSNVYKNSLKVKYYNNTLIIGALRHCNPQVFTSKLFPNHLAEKYEYIHRDIHLDKKINEKSILYNFRSDVLFVDLEKINEDK